MFVEFQISCCCVIWSAALLGSVQGGGDERGGQRGRDWFVACSVGQGGGTRSFVAVVL